MGYRSCVAMLMYGEKKDCDMAVDLLRLKFDDEYLRELFDRQKQEHQDLRNPLKYWVMWTFDDIKWYSDCEAMQDALFCIVDDINDAPRDESGETTRSMTLAVEFVRVGEGDDDNEHKGTRDHDWHLAIQRKIDFPDFFEWR